MRGTLHPSDPAHVDQLIPINGRAVERVWLPERELEPSTFQRLVGLCEAHNREQCGLISSEEEIYTITNVHEEPKHNFLMDQVEYIEAVQDIYDLGQYVLGVYHTHPNNVVWPSPRDLRGWPDPSLGWRYWIVTNFDLIEWQLL